MLSADKEFYEKLSGKKLSEKEASEAQTNLVGFFDVLYQADKRLAKNKSEQKSSAGSTQSFKEPEKNI